MQSQGKIKGQDNGNEAILQPEVMSNAGFIT